VHAVWLPTLNEPAAHAVPAAVMEGHAKPAGHGVQADAVDSEYEPGEHGTGAAVGSLHELPAGQFVHAVAPPSANRPAAQAVGALMLLVGHR
jgi:hypothetical protein